MTFLIAISDNKIARIAADGQITKDDKAIKNNFKKIRKYPGANFPVFIGSAGDVGFTNNVYRKLDQISLYSSNYMTAYDYANKVKELIDEGFSVLKLDSNILKVCFVILSRTGFIGNDPINFHMYFIDAKNSSPQQISPITNEKYACIYNNTCHLDTKILDSLVDKHLYSKNDLSIDENLKNLFKEISDLDSTVNNNVTIISDI